ncbi:MAG TPA: hypothetical protein PL020_01805 [Candidatus Cloacimonadota bacterium]|nr:hypothetical protein [Candidatus Cloacimonadota bacterium]
MDIKKDSTTANHHERSAGASSEQYLCSQHTVVTACDHSFLWGALLLGLSMRYQGMICPYHVLAYDLSLEDTCFLESIPGTKVFPTTRTDSRSICTQKPGAIATAETDIIVWMDADCIVSGNLERFFVCPDNTIQIRQRGKEENASVYRNYYSHGDSYGSIPRKVREQWQQDVGDLQSSRIERVYQTNCFVLNRSHLDFIDIWQKQMEKVIPLHTTGVYNSHSIAYSMTDESVINSLFAYSSAAPMTSEYLMDKDPDAACIHFGLNPKPWQHWTLQAFKVYGYVQSLLQWASEQNIALPQLPASFLNQNMQKEYRRAKYSAMYKELRYQASSGLRAGLRHLHLK